MYKKIFITVGILSSIFACNNSNNEKTQTHSDTTVLALKGIENLPNTFDTSTEFISVADYFSIDQVNEFATKKFMALIQDTTTKKYSLIQAIPNKHSYAISENKISIFSNFLEVDEDGNVGYLVDIDLPIHSKCLFLIQNKYMTTPQMNVENKIQWGQFIEPNKNIQWNQGTENHTINATATFEKNTNKGINYKDYSLRYIIENDGKKTQNIPLNFIPWFDDGFVKILYIGDLDGDNLNDIIIDNCHKYTNENIEGVLFSTKASGNGTPKAISKQDWGSLRGAEFHIEGC